MALFKYSCPACGKEIKSHIRNRDDTAALRKRMDGLGVVCRACDYKRRKEAIKEAGEQALASAEEDGLPILTGTKSQQTWAAAIRQDAIREAEALVGILKVAKKSGADAGLHHARSLAETPSQGQRLFRDSFRLAMTVEDPITFLQTLKSISHAKWWIDRRAMRAAEIAARMGGPEEQSAPLAAAS